MKRIALLLVLICAACSANKDAVLTVDTPSTTSTTATVALEMPDSGDDGAPNPTVAPGPSPAPEIAPIEPGSADDPWGPVLCPYLPHPAHHEPCPPYDESADPAAGVGGAAPGGKSAGDSGIAPSGTSGVDIVCESGGNYGLNTGNGYYGAYQWEPPTFDQALYEAYGYGYVTLEEQRTWTGVSPDQVPPHVQDAAAAGHVDAGFRDAWPNC